MHLQICRPNTMNTSMILATLQTQASFERSLLLKVATYKFQISPITLEKSKSILERMLTNITLWTKINHMLTNKTSLTMNIDHTYT
jgi:hypothetical protein